MAGLFITLEGGEGSGKSTQAAGLAAAVQRAGRECVLTREPGGSANADLIRTLLVSGDHAPFDPLAETLLFMAARVEHARGVIAPALAAGKVVVCDRFLDSTLVYQGIGKGLGEGYIRMLHQATLGNLLPDVTLILDIAPETGLARAADRRGTEARFEAMDIGFHRAVRAGFLALAQREPGRCAVFNAAQDRDALALALWDHVRPRLG